MSHPPVTMHPDFAQVEVSALIAMLGTKDRTYTLRGFAELGPWLDEAIGSDATVAVDDLRNRLSIALASGDEAMAALSVTSSDYKVIRAAMSHAVGVTRTDALFGARYGVNRQRALHLRSALRLEHAVAKALVTANDACRAAIAPMMEAAREMRRWRLDRYDGYAALVQSPELNLLSDALAVATGRGTFGFLQADIQRAWDTFAFDRQRAREVATTIER